MAARSARAVPPDRTRHSLTHGSRMCRCEKKTNPRSPVAVAAPHKDYCGDLKAHFFAQVLAPDKEL